MAAVGRRLLLDGWIYKIPETNTDRGGRTRPNTVPVLHELKVISSSQSRYKPSWKKMGADKRSEDLHDEYVKKARIANQEHSGAQPGQTGRVAFPRVEGIVFGNCGEPSEATHRLVIALATSRTKVADPQGRKKGDMVMSDEGVKSLAVGFIRRTLGSQLGKHSVSPFLEAGAVSAANSRRRAAEQERLWIRERRAFALANKQSYNIIIRGFAKLD